MSFNANYQARERYEFLRLLAGTHTIGFEIFWSLLMGLVQDSLCLGTEKLEDRWIVGGSTLGGLFVCASHGGVGPRTKTLSFELNLGIAARREDPLVKISAE